MAERQHTTGKASEPAKGVKRYAAHSDMASMHAAGKADFLAASTTVGRLPHSRVVERSSEHVESSVLAAGARSGKDIIGRPDYDFKIILDLLGGSQILGSAIKSDLDAHELLHRGLPRGAVTSLVENLHVIPVIEVSEALGVSLRTLQRHKSSPVALLDVQQSGRTWKFAEILAKATGVLGSQDEAEQWLRRPAIGLDQRRPVDLLTTPAGVKLVEDYLGRLEYDVYT